MKSWIEVSAARLQANFAAVQAAVGPEIEVLAVIKADAYGHGAALCAPVLGEAGARWLGVGDLEEGLRVRHTLREAGLADRETNLLVMCGFEAEDAPGIVAADLTAVVWTVEHVQALERAAHAANRRVAVHLELDTGMARQGVRPGPGLAAVLEALFRSPRVRWEGVFSHLSSAEVVGSAQTQRQEAVFGEGIAQVFQQPIPPEYIHLCNSSAVDEGSSLRWLQGGHGSMQPLLVRPGLALYGYTLPLEREPHAGPAGDVPGSGQESKGLLSRSIQPAAAWKTRVVGLREIAAGDTVGYGATFVAEHPMRLALLPVGYADGFRREGSSGVGDGWVIVAGRRARVVGRVSMNLTVVDVTGHAAVREGDEVVLLGEGVTADDHARWCGTISYEILCGMRGHRRLV